MKILLIAPLQDDANCQNWGAPHLGFMRIDSYLKSKISDLDITIFDPQIDKYNPHKHGDAIFMTIRSHTVNHVGVYTKNGLMMHHLCNRLSIEEPVMIYKDSIGATYRHEELK